MSAGAIRTPLIIPLRLPDPGIPKSRIDTNTRLEILSETPSTEIYFTINGSRPVVKRTEKELLDSGSFRFRKPFVLPAGTQTVRAVAFLPDTGMTSNVVTKTFDVAKAEPHDDDGKSDHPDDYRFLEDLRRIEAHRTKSKRRSSDKSKRGNRSGVCRTRTKRSDDDEATEISENDNVQSEVKDFHPSSPFTAQQPNHCPQRDRVNVRKLQQVTDPLHCPHCFSRRPPDSYHNFCSHCGYPLPRLPAVQPVSTAPDQLICCISCGSKVPSDLNTCLVCEHPLHTSLSEKVSDVKYQLCDVCHAFTPVPSAICFTCEAPFPTAIQNRINPTANHITPSVSPPSHRIHYTVFPENSLTTPSCLTFACPHCRCQNKSDAYYCNWCGLEMSKLGSSDAVDMRDKSIWNTMIGGPALNQVNFISEDAGSMLQCTHCKNHVIRSSQFCSCCGNRLEVQAAPNAAVGSGGDRFRSIGLADAKSVPAVSNATTQTFGLFYPSSAEIRRQGSSSKFYPPGNPVARDRTPLLTAVSPGRGFWRKQLDHIFAHLKVYTNNNPEFRAAVSEPRMGKLVSADLRETGPFATITLSYLLVESYKNNLNRSVELISGSLPDSGTSSISARQQPENKHEHPNSPKLIDVVAPHTNETNQSSPHSAFSADDLKTAAVDRKKHSTQSSLNRAASDSELNHANSSDMRSVNKKLQLGEYSEPTTDERRTKLGNQRPVSRKKSGSINVKSAHHGEAGVALMRQAKLTADDLCLLNMLSKKKKICTVELAHLLKKGANPNCVDANGNTPLILAVRNHKPEAISVLTEHGADINKVVPPNGNTALHEAVRLGYDGVDSVEELLKMPTAVQKKKRKRPRSFSERSRTVRPLICRSQ